MGLSVVVAFLVLVSLTLASTSDNSLDAGDRVVMVAPVLAPPKDSRVRSNDRSRQFPVLVLLAQKNPDRRAEQAAKSLRTNPQPIYVQKLEDQKQEVHTNRQKRHLHLAKKLLSGGFGGTFSYGGGYQGQSGGHGCNGGCGGGYQQEYSHGYQEPPKTVVVKVVKEYEVNHGHQGGGGYNHGGGYGGGYGGGGGGYGGGYGGGGGHGGGGGGGGYGGGGNNGYVQQPVHQPVYQPSGGGCNTCGGGGGGGNGQATATATATATAHASSGSYGKR